MTNIDYNAELESCKQHVKEVRAVLKTLHGDLCHVQVALQDIEVDVYSLERDYKIVLSSLDRLSAETKDDGNPPNPPTTPTTPRAPWHQDKAASVPEKENE